MRNLVSVQFSSRRSGLTYISQQQNAERVVLIRSVKRALQQLAQQAQPAIAELAVPRLSEQLHQKGVE